MHTHINSLWALVTASIFALSVASTLYAADDPLDFFDDETTLQSQDCPPPAPMSTCSDEEIQGIVSLIIGLDAICLLQQDLYKRTNELNQRSLLDYGLFLPQKFYCKPNTLGFHTFYNQTTRDNFTRTSTDIESYLAIFKPTLIQEIIRVIDNAGFELPIDPQAILPLFKCATIQERRTGFMMHYMHRWQNNVRLRLMAPLYYLESNFFLTPQELDRIEEQLGITDPEEDDRFARNHLIADTFGLGDTRLNLDMPVVRSGSTKSRIGLMATIPTAFAIKKGLYGSHFKPPMRQAPIDLCTIFNLAVQDDDALIQLGQQLAYDFIDHLSANLIQSPLGNGGHFGIGLYMRSKIKLNSLIKRPWAKHTIRSRTSLEYLVPHREKRFYIECDDTPRFEALGLLRPTNEIIDEIFEDPAYARQVLSFLQEQLTDKFFPFVLSTKVQPGLIFRWTSRYIYERPEWGWYAGTDTWLTSKEKLKNIHVPKNYPQPLNERIAHKPFGYQVGFLGSVFWKPKKDLLISLNSQYNFTSTGIGSDYLISFNLEKTF